MSVFIKVKEAEFDEPHNAQQVSSMINKGFTQNKIEGYRTGGLAYSICKQNHMELQSDSINQIAEIVIQVNFCSLE